MLNLSLANTEISETVPEKEDLGKFTQRCLCVKII